MKRPEIKLKNMGDNEIGDLLPDNLIILGYRGSIAHGMYIPSEDPNSIDDKDLMGVFIPGLEHYFGLHKHEHHEKFIKEWDSVSYELVKFVRLLLKCNPNVLSLLWLNENHYLYVHPVGRKLIENRDIFVTKEAYHSFNGYAWGQFNRMIKFSFEGYMGEKRKSLVEKYGYDTKNAAHLVRLLDMGIEFLNEGRLYVERKHPQKYLAIKRGEWSLDEVKKEANRLFSLAQESYVKSSLPMKPDRKKADQLLIDLIKEYHNL